jgi:hypothetical protein
MYQPVRALVACGSNHRRLGRVVFPRLAQLSGEEFPRQAGGKEFIMEGAWPMTGNSLSQPRADLTLRHSPIPALRRLRVEETTDAIIVMGSVSSYYLKQMAQEALMPILGPRQLRNQVSVQRA